MWAPGILEAALSALPDELKWEGRPTPEVLAKLPGCAAVYLLLGAAGEPIQLATTQHLRRLALARLTTTDEQRPGRTDIAEIARAVRWRQVHSVLEGRWCYYQLARQAFPNRYRRLVSFGPVWYLRVDWVARVPEITVTKHVYDKGGSCNGPWMTRDLCQKALEGLWDLFDLCRYPEQVRRAPEGTRCAYAEMGRCDAPCDGTVPLEQYVARCRAAWRFAQGEVRPWIEDARQRMKAAAAEQKYERAAQLKQQIAFAWKWHDQWCADLRPAETTAYLMAAPVTRRRSWKLFAFRCGHLQDGPILSDRKLAAEGVAWAVSLPAPDDDATDALVRTEQAWLVEHWRHSREGDASIVLSDAFESAPDALAERLRAALASKRDAQQKLDEDATGAKP